MVIQIAENLFNWLLFWHLAPNLNLNFLFWCSLLVIKFWIWILNPHFVVKCGFGNFVPIPDRNEISKRNVNSKTIKIWKSSKLDVMVIFKRKILNTGCVFGFHKPCAKCWWFNIRTWKVRPWFLACQPITTCSWYHIRTRGVRQWSQGCACDIRKRGVRFWFVLY